MLRNGFIKFLALILAVLAVSPVCHALGNGLAGAHEDLAGSGFTRSGVVDGVLMLPGEPTSDHCWMQQAHLFEAPAVMGAYVPLVFVFTLVVLAAFVVAMDGAGYLRVHRKPPWRLPPSRSMLQIFRN